MLDHAMHTVLPQMRFQPGLCATSPKPKYDLADWLAMHGLTAATCHALIQRSAEFIPERAEPPFVCDLSAQEAWDLSAEALLERFPAGADPIDCARDETALIFNSGGGRPLAMPRSEAGGALVRVPWRGRVADLLAVAHEFGHAVQIMAKGKDFMPPVLREICAFISEVALLQALKAREPRLHLQARAAWAAMNRYYVARCSELLAAALRDPRSTYRYDWNYAIARTLASDCLEAFPEGGCFRIFENRISLSGIVQFLACERRKNPSCDGACLQFSASVLSGPELPVP